MTVFDDNSYLPKYCTHCGSPLRQKNVLVGYDETYGTPIYYKKLICTSTFGFIFHPVLKYDDDNDPIYEYGSY